MSYSSVARMRVRMSNIAVADLANTNIEEAMDKADAMVDMHLGSRYSVPLSAPIPNIIRSLSEEIATYYIVVDNILGGSVVNPFELVDDRYKKAMKMLEKLASGKLALSGVTAIQGETSRVYDKAADEDYQRVFDVDHETEWGVDGNLLDDIEDDRDDAETTLPS